MQKIILFILLTITYSAQSADFCLSIGDSQSSGPANGNYGSVLEMHKTINKNGYNAFTYAMPGSGAIHWALPEPKGRKSAFPKYFFKDKSATKPYQRKTAPYGNDLTSELKFKRAGGKYSFFDQVLAKHADKKNDLKCFLIQLGDNDLFRAEKSVDYIAKMIKTLKTYKYSPEVCGVITPFFRGKRSGYNKVTNDRKMRFIKLLTAKLKSLNLFKYCPVLSSMTSNARSRLRGNFTTDGLHLNNSAGKIWIEEALLKHPKL